MYEFIRDCKRLGELMEVVPEEYEGWWCIFNRAGVDVHESYDYLLHTFSASTRSAGIKVLLPPLSWLVRELMRLSYEYDLGWDFGPGEDDEWNVTVFDGVKHSFDAPTPEGACVKALIAIKEAQNDTGRD